MYKRLELERGNVEAVGNNDHIHLTSVNGSRFSRTVASGACMQPLLGPTGDDQIEGVEERNLSSFHTSDYKKENCELTKEAKVVF